jgi:hypothetical protein
MSEGQPGVLVEICEVRDTKDGRQLEPLFRQRIALSASDQQRWKTCTEQERAELARQVSEEPISDMWAQLEEIMGFRPAAEVRVSSTVIDEEHPAGPAQMRRFVEGVERWETVPLYDEEWP